MTIFGTGLGSYLGKPYVGMALVQDATQAGGGLAQLPVIGQTAHALKEELDRCRAS